MSFFEDIAAPLIARKIPVIPLRPQSKIALLDNWPELASLDINQIHAWGEQFPTANCGSVAKAQIGGYWIWEVDSPEVIQRLEKETGQKLPRTYRIRSSPGRGHIYLRQNAESIVMGNIGQAFVKNGDWSARVHNQYCVSENSLHPRTGKPYEAVSIADAVEAPIWLIEWLKSQKVEAKKVGYTLEGDEKIPFGSHDTALTSIAGKLRQMGLEEEAIYHAILEVCEKRCEGHGADYAQMCRKISSSICRYAPGKEPIQPLIWNKVEVQQPIALEDMEDVPDLVVPPYPVFPNWILDGCSVYEGLIRPFCEVNSRYESFMFIPAVVIMLNYLGTKVRVEFKDMIPSLYTVLIGRKGRVIKSSSVQDAMNYFRYAGILDHGGPNVRNAEGKTLVWTAGSPEGLGIDMQKTNCRNSILFYDELSTLTNKAGIESSTLVSSLLLMYESGKFANNIKSKKDTFSIDPGTYCASLIACTTDKNFKSLWGKMSGVTSGLNDRFFFLFQPETFKPVTPYIAVNTQQGAIRTRQLIDKAVDKGVYSIVDSSPFHAKMNGDDAYENRQEIRAEKFALYFAVDMGLDEINEDCVERSLAIIEYERAVKRRLRPTEALTKEAGIQNDVIDFLMQDSRGVQNFRDMQRVLHPERYGTTLWGQAYYGLMKSGQIAEIGKGTKTDPKKVILMRAPEGSEE